MAQQDLPRLEPERVDNERLLQYMDELESVQETLEQLDDKAAEEIMAIETKYLLLKQPMYKNRRAFTKQIPQFWLRALKAHPILQALLGELDIAVLTYAEDLNVEEFEDASMGYLITFLFLPNPYFNNATVVKQFMFAEDLEDDLLVQPTVIRWKDPAFPEKHPDSLFSTWQLEDDRSADFGEAIKNQIWPNPIPYWSGMTSLGE